MGMDKINGSPLLQQGILDSSRQKDKVDAKRVKDADLAETPATGPAPTFGDTADISATAHRLMALRQAVDVGRMAMTILPEVRADKVAQARERLASGFYDSSAVQKKIADGLLDVFTSLEKLSP